jgi:atlastin
MEEYSNRGHTLSAASEDEALNQHAVQSEDDWDKVSDDIPSVETENPKCSSSLSNNGTRENDFESDVAFEEADDNQGPSALQIVSIGTESNQYAFTFHEKALTTIMNKVPSDYKVCVVSVVGAFRTGKSFLLSWFLKYLHHLENLEVPNEKDENTQDSKESKNSKWYEDIESIGNNGFDWRGGAERNTTGIWMWSKPYLLPRNAGSTEKLAVLLVDTQGMFDHETTMGLTAAIFGLSTLLSSYQIYNVDKRIQEDNLQQLALFSEYGRMALQSDASKANAKESESHSEEISSEDVAQAKPKPFQKIEFLVRDWQNFEDDENFEACEGEMKEYLESVLAEREASDLKDTRDQITSCFEEVSCYLMTHPGFAVTKKKYSGDVSMVEPTFKVFMDRYCRKVFGNLIAKSIHGRELTAMELGAYIHNYAKMFESGAHFPEAATMLEATASANNSNATSLSIRKYKEHMDQLAGAKCSHYLEPTELDKCHMRCIQECIDLFDSIANFGSSKAITESRNEVIRSIEESFEMYSKLNDSRNPLLGFETYIIPLAIGAVSVVLRWVADFTCSSWSQTCRVGSEVLSHIYQVVFFFIVIVAATKAKQVSEAAGRVKKAFEAMNSNSSKKEKHE